VVQAHWLLSLFVVNVSENAFQSFVLSCTILLLMDETLRVTMLWDRDLQVSVYLGQGCRM